MIRIDPSKLDDSLKEIYFQIKNGEDFELQTSKLEEKANSQGSYLKYMGTTIEATLNEWLSRAIIKEHVVNSIKRNKFVGNTYELDGETSVSLWDIGMISIYKTIDRTPKNSLGYIQETSYKENDLGKGIGELTMYISQTFRQTTPKDISEIRENTLLWIPSFDGSYKKAICERNERMVEFKDTGEKWTSREYFKTFLKDRAQYIRGPEVRRFQEMDYSYDSNNETITTERLSLDIKTGEHPKLYEMSRNDYYQILKEISPKMGIKLISDSPTQIPGFRKENRSFYTKFKVA